jgi:hypothetical protein
MVFAGAAPHQFYDPRGGERYLSQRCFRPCKNAIIAQKSIAGALENRAPSSGFNLLDENGDLNGAHLPP